MGEGRPYLRASDAPPSHDAGVAPPTTRLCLMDGRRPEIRPVPGWQGGEHEVVTPKPYPRSRNPGAVSPEIPRVEAHEARRDAGWIELRRIRQTKPNPEVPVGGSRAQAGVRPNWWSRCLQGGLPRTECALPDRAGLGMRRKANCVRPRDASHAAACIDSATPRRRLVPAVGWSVRSPMGGITDRRRETVLRPDISWVL